MFVSMTIHDASQQLRFQLLALYSDREAGNITDMVMEKITCWRRIDRVVNKTVPLSDPQKVQWQTYLTALLAHKPVQYVLQEAWFYGMLLYVNEDVLIPRPETEELVDWLIKDHRVAGSPIVLDIGTGSGCLPLAIKKSLSKAVVHACDTSAAALAVAKKNAARQQAELIFHQTDILSTSEASKLPMVDLIISNPPYIPHSDIGSMQKNVLDYEPHLALFVPNDKPLVFYVAIRDFAITHLQPGGELYLELHEEYADAVAVLFNTNDFSNIEKRKDMQGRDRMLRVSRSPD